VDGRRGRVKRKQGRAAGRRKKEKRKRKTEEEAVRETKPARQNKHVLQPCRSSCETATKPPRNPTYAPLLSFPPPPSPNVQTHPQRPGTRTQPRLSCPSAPFSPMHAFAAQTHSLIHLPARLPSALHAASNGSTVQSVMVKQLIIPSARPQRWSLDAKNAKKSFARTWSKGLFRPETERANLGLFEFCFGKFTT